MKIGEVDADRRGPVRLVYGVLDPQDMVIRGLGDIPADPAARLRTLFPPPRPYRYARF